jgi:hypothetical protein
MIGSIQDIHLRLCDFKADACILDKISLLLMPHHGKPQIRVTVRSTSLHAAVGNDRVYMHFDELRQLKRAIPESGRL